jgi:hypothetical protein
MDRRAPSADLCGFPGSCGPWTLTDPPMTTDQARVLGGWIAGQGMNLTDIFITHGDGDHRFVAEPLAERSGRASSPRRARSRRCAPTPQRDRCYWTSCTRDPADVDLVVAGDAIYNGVHWGPARRPRLTSDEHGPTTSTGNARLRLDREPKHDQQTSRDRADTGLGQAMQEALARYHGGPGGPQRADDGGQGTRSRCGSIACTSSVMTPSRTRANSGPERSWRSRRFSVRRGAIASSRDPCPSLPRACRSRSAAGAMAGSVLPGEAPPLLCSRRALSRPCAGSRWSLSSTSRSRPAVARV